MVINQGDIFGIEDEIRLVVEPREAEQTFLSLLNFMGLNLSSASDKVRRAHPTIQLGCIPNSLHSAAANSKHRSSF